MPATFAPVELVTFAAAGGSVTVWPTRVADHVWVTVVALTTACDTNVGPPATVTGMTPTTTAGLEKVMVSVTVDAVNAAVKVGTVGT